MNGEDAFFIFRTVSSLATTIAELISDDEPSCVTSAAALLIACIILAVSALSFGLIGYFIGASMCGPYSTICVESIIGVIVGAFVGLIVAPLSIHIFTLIRTITHKAAGRDSEAQLMVAIRLVNTGDHRVARHYLGKILEEEPENELAWFWLAQCAVSRANQIYALKKVLEINPMNKKARKVLERIENDNPRQGASEDY